MQQPSKPVKKTVGDGCAAYESMLLTWRRNRAILGGQSTAREFDKYVKLGENLLIPFSPMMDLARYEFLKAESELPGLVGQYASVVVGGLLRKAPVIETEAPREAIDWITNSIGADNSPITAFLSECLAEEIQTSRAWVVVDHPTVNADDWDNVKDKVAPFARLYRAEQVIN